MGHTIIKVVEMKVEIRKKKKGPKDLGDYGRAQNMMLFQVLIKLEKLRNCVHCIKGYVCPALPMHVLATSKNGGYARSGHVVCWSGRPKSTFCPRTRCTNNLAISNSQSQRFSPVPTYIHGFRLIVRPSVVPLPSMTLFDIRRCPQFPSRALGWLFNPP